MVAGKRLTVHAAFVLLLGAYGAHQALARASAECRIKDLMSEYWAVVDAPRDQAVPSFRRRLVDANGDLYGAGGVGFKSPEALDAAIVRSLDHAARERDNMMRMSDILRAELPGRLKHFRAAFPDFRCDFTIFLLPSLGRLDGAGRRVNKQGVLIFGLDNLSDEFHTAPGRLGLLFDHELFHRYHSQVAGFSDDRAEREVIWRTLWAEGLATYVSQQLNPPASLQDALFVPADLVARAAPLTRALSKRLKGHLDAVDPPFFAEFSNITATRVRPRLAPATTWAPCTPQSFIGRSMHWHT